MLLGRIKSLSMSNPCVFQNGPNKLTQTQKKKKCDDYLYAAVKYSYQLWEGGGWKGRSVLSVFYQADF